MVDKKKNDFPEKMSDEDLRRIAGLIASLPDREPPEKLIDSVMARIKPKKLGRIRMLWRRMQAPVAFAPLRMASVAGSLALAFLVVFVLVERAPEQTPLTSLRQEGTKKGQTVVFTLNMPGASRVELIGSFNHWRPGDFLMKWDESRKAWIVSLSLEKGRYEYAFLVDGEKIVPDPSALIDQDDGFGNKNSVLVIERNGRHEAGI